VQRRIRSATGSAAALDFFRSPFLFYWPWAGAAPWGQTLPALS